MEKQQKKNSLRLSLEKIFALSLIAGFTLQPRADLIEGVPLRGFSDVSYIYDRNDNTNSFQIHDFDLFLAKSIDNHVNFLAEVNFQPGLTGVVVDLERSYIQYVANPWLKIAVGRFHTALGYWNETFHHGSYLQTSASRPVMERFEDNGGLLPVHSTGIEIRGNGRLTDVNFGYIFDVGNGRGPVKDPPAFFLSYPRSKSVSGVLFVEFDSGLRLGVNGLRGDLPGGATRNDDGTPNTGVTGPKGVEVIYGAHVIYNSPYIEWLTEYNHMVHTYKGGYTNVDGSDKTKINLLYSQFGVHIGSWTPYVRYEINATDHTDAYLNASPGYNAQGLISSTQYFVGGLRYELSSASALKYEATYVKTGSAYADQYFVGNTTRKSNFISNLNWSYSF